MAIGKVEYFEPRGDLNCPHGEIVLFLLIFESTAFEHADQMLVLSEEATILLFVDLYIVLHCIGSSEPSKLVLEDSSHLLSLNSF